MKLTTGTHRRSERVGGPTGRRGTRHPWDDLAELDYFADLAPAAVRLASRNADWVEVAPGTRLQRQGWRTSWLWIPIDGPLELRRDGELVGLVPAGEAVGETELLHGMAAPVDVVAPTTTTVVSLPSRAFHGLLGEASFADAVARRQAGHRPARPTSGPRIFLVPA